MCSDSEDSQTCMVPYADMMNHNSKKSNYWGYDIKLRSFIVRANHDIESGEEIFINYAENRNIRSVLFQYGFIDPYNKVTEVEIDIVIDSTTPAYQIKLDELEPP
jgi:hypothetical protein